MTRDWISPLTAVEAEQLSLMRAQPTPLALKARALYIWHAEVRAMFYQLFN